MVIVVRTDIKMSTGKLSAQVAHASVSCVLEAIEKGGRYLEWLEAWVKEGQKKIVLKAKTLDGLLDIYNKSLMRRLPTCIIKDAGHTELPPGTITCVGIGPAPEDVIDEITGELDLL